MSHSARRSRRHQDGSATVEAAVVLPVLAVVTLLLAWGLTFGVTQVRVLDAAREAARAAARSDSTAEAVSLARRVAPRGAQIRLEHRGDTVLARVTTQVRGPAGAFGFLGPVEVSAEAVAAREPAP